MLIPLLFEHPQYFGAVLRSTPSWVWMLLAVLVAFGLSQVRNRTASLARVTIQPLAMAAFAIWGLTGAFSKSPLFGYAMLAWMLVVAIVFCAIGLTSAPKGTTYDAETRSFHLPGSWVPMALILAIFLTRYVVNVDIAMHPDLVRDGQYTLAAAALYGVSTGAFLGRAARLWRMVAEHGGAGFLLQRDPW